MNLTMTPTGGATARITLGGRFDAHRCPEFDAWIDAALDADRPRLIVDLSDTRFIDSAGLAALVRGMKRCRARGGDLVLSAPSTPARAILELTRLDRAFTVQHGDRTGATSGG